MLAANVLDELECLRFAIGGEVDDDVQVAVKLHPVFGDGAEDQKSSAALGTEGSHFGHDEIGRGPPSGGLTGFPLGYGHDAGHRSFSAMSFVFKYKQPTGNIKGRLSGPDVNNSGFCLSSGHDLTPVGARPIGDRDAGQSLVGALQRCI
ncbi:MAG TPA: hypothetical protein VI251_15955 [Pseudolabrys sp.]